MIEGEVYWIHFEEHTDPETEGLVGVTTNWEQRNSAYSTLMFILEKELGKKVIKDVIFSGSQQDCYDEEERLRPVYGIGWNKSKGGNKGYGKGYKQKGIPASGLCLAVGEDRSEKQKAAAKEHSERMKKNPKPENLTNKFGAIKKVRYNNIVYSSCGELAKAVNRTPATISRWIKQGWAEEVK